MAEKKVPPRVIIDRIYPAVDCGKFPVKRVINEIVRVRAIILCDGHDIIKGNLLYRFAGERVWKKTALSYDENDGWHGHFIPDRIGTWQYAVEADIDHYGTWRRDLLKRLEAGQNVRADIRIGMTLLKDWQPQLSADFAEEVSKAIETLEQLTRQDDNELSHYTLRQIAENTALMQIAMSIRDDRHYVRSQTTYEVSVEPVLAGFSAWYEFFPRSTSGKPDRHGTFKECERQLEYIADLGFDIAYLPPVHPIGVSFRKGKNNALAARPDDVGSPWAIGGKEGGHKAIHPDLGTLEDFRSLVAKAENLGLKIALDIAFQVSPDHPYVTEHPEWFYKRPDGSIQYAENPPKKYQDIYPLNFENENWQALWEELKSVIFFWVENGVRVFRVDNPHTKPFHFWQWLIAKTQKKYPDVIFLSEAFTRPHRMAYLAKAGFSQSYTYFAWRSTKHDLISYMTELTRTELQEYFRPNFWPNTPDILTEQLQTGNRDIFIQRLILAATLTASYGIYGPAFELMEHVPREHGSEEYMDSEKYEIRVWDLQSEKSLAPLIKQLNHIRHINPALQSNRNLRFHAVDNDALLAYSKATDDNSNIILVIVNLTPATAQSGIVDFAIHELGIKPGVPYDVCDTITGTRYQWRDWRNYVALYPAKYPAHIFTVKQSVTDY